MWGLQPAASHIVNVALHALNALLVFRVLRRLGIRGAWFAAAIFALHPVHVESVAWIIERKNVLSGAFYLLALLFYLRFEQRRNGAAYWWSLVSSALALLSKSSTVTLSVAVVLCRFHLRRSWSRGDVGRLVPFFAMACLMASVCVGYERVQSPLLEGGLDVGLAERAAIAGLNTWFYLGKLALPVQLTFVYEKWQFDASSLWPYLPAAGVLAALVILWLRRRRWGDGPLLASIFYVATLFPVLGLFRFFYQGISDAADHFQYLPSLGLIALFGGAAGHWVGRWSRNGGGLARVLAWAGAAGLIALLGVLTWARCQVYKDDYTIRRDTLAKSPDSCIARGFLATAAAGRGETDTAIFLLDEAIRRCPPHPRRHISLGVIYRNLGRLDEAEASFRTAIDANPRYMRAYLRLGDLYVQMKRFREAVGVYEQALHLEFNRQPALFHFRLAIALRGLGRHAAAAEHYRKALELAPHLRRRATDRQKE